MKMYAILKTRPIKFENKKFSKKLLKQSLDACYNECAFSTFPYIHGKLSSSKEALKKYNSGCCIAMCIFLKDWLKSKGITSYLIPATIPNKYKMSGYLDIAHVALVVPINEDRIYLMDPAFYFIHPASINLRINNETKVALKLIYTEEVENELSKYTSIKDVKCRTMKTTKRIQFNDYQSMPKNTFFVSCNSKTDELWEYYIREIINPDEAICKFFIGIRTKPFITLTTLDSNGIVRSKGFLLENLNNGTIQFGRGDGTIQMYNKSELTPELKQEINNLFGTMRCIKDNDAIF
jgi:hypothetical protein